jgi:aminopeptidase N
LIFTIFALQIKIMRNLFSLGIASCLIITAACHSSKKSVSSKKEEVVTVLPPDDAITINMDTITVTTKKTPTKEVYRKTNTITSDIIHTKLEVNFDWNKSYMNGIATIQVQPYFYATNKLYLNARGMTINSTY